MPACGAREKAGGKPQAKLAPQVTHDPPFPPTCKYRSRGLRPLPSYQEMNGATRREWDGSRSRESGDRAPVEPQSPRDLPLRDPIRHQRPHLRPFQRAPHLRTSRLTSPIQPASKPRTVCLRVLNCAPRARPSLRQASRAGARPPRSSRGRRSLATPWDRAVDRRRSIR
jgi:hypothetical protein